MEQLPLATYDERTPGGGRRQFALHQDRLLLLTKHGSTETQQVIVLAMLWPEPSYVRFRPAAWQTGLVLFVPAALLAVAGLFAFVRVRLDESAPALARRVPWLTLIAAVLAIPGLVKLVRNWRR